MNDTDINRLTTGKSRSYIPVSEKSQNNIERKASFKGIVFCK